MTTSVAKKLAHLRKVDFKPWSATLWLVKRRLDLQKKAHYSVLRVDTDKKLQNKLKKGVTDKIQNRDYTLEDYDFLTADQDDRLLTIDATETDFLGIQNAIDNGLTNKKVESYDDLLDSWAFVLKLEHAGSVIYGLRKISKLTRAIKIKAISYFLFENQKLVDLDDKKVFSLDMHVDFFVYDGTTFIVNKREFESAMNFREGMEKNRDAVIAEFAALASFSDVEPIRNVVGSNLHLLRKLSTIKNSGYYKDKKFMQSLIDTNREKGWNLTVVNGVIAIDESNVEFVLKLLNNERVESQINQEVFDAVVKKKVA